MITPMRIEASSTAIEASLMAIEASSIEIVTFR
jgi:hypothetical protein